MGSSASAIAGGVGGVASGITTALTEKKAAGVQERALQAGSMEQMLMAAQAMKQLKPYRQFGVKALPIYEQALIGGGAESAYRASPGYQFALEQGIKARERSAAAGGGLLSGAQQQALTEYGQGLAAQDYQQWLQNLYGGLAQFGYPAATSTANILLGQGAQRAETVRQRGEAEAAGIYGVGQGINQAIGGMTGAAGAMGGGIGAPSNVGLGGFGSLGSQSTMSGGYGGLRSYGGLRGYA